MVILGVILGIGALVCFLVRQFVMKDKAILNKVAAGLALAAGKYKYYCYARDALTLYYSYYMCIHTI